jgi:membrane-associated phospholipid phosphatase
MHTHSPLLKIFANSINPALTLFLIIAFIGVNRQFISAEMRTKYLSGVALGLLLTYVAAHINRWLHLWPAHRLFPSGHMTYALCILTSLFLLRREWTRVLLPFTVLLIAVYGYLMVRLGFHDWFDIAGAVIMSPPLTLWAHRLCGNKELAREPVVH